jgi:hypothetical protein
MVAIWALLLLFLQMASRQRINRDSFSCVTDDASSVTNNYKETAQDKERHLAFCKLVHNMFEAKNMKTTLIGFRNIAITSNNHYEDVYGIYQPSSAYTEDTSRLISDIQAVAPSIKHMRVERSMSLLLLYVPIHETRVSGRTVTGTLLLSFGCVAMLVCVYVYLYKVNPGLYKLF